MSVWVGRLIAYVFLGAFCLAGPLLLLFALATAMQRGALALSGTHAEALVIGTQQRGSEHGRARRSTYAPVFRFTAGDGRAVTVNSDVYGNAADFPYGTRIPVLYWPDRPGSARIDDFGQLWMLPLVLGAVGAAFSIVPGILCVAWMRRRASALGGQRGEAVGAAADAVSRGFRRVLGALLVAGGVALLAAGLGVIGNDSGVGGARLLAISVGVLLSAAGVQVGQWVPMGSRLADACGSLVVTSMAAMFGWVAVYGDAAGFSGSAGIGGISIATGSAAGTGRFVFGAAAVLTGLIALWTWQRVLRAR